MEVYLVLILIISLVSLWFSYKTYSKKRYLMKRCPKKLMESYGDDSDCFTTGCPGSQICMPGVGCV